MKKLILILFLILPGQLFAEDVKRDNGFYGSLSGMVSVKESSAVKVEGIEAAVAEFDTGLGYAFALGKRFGSGFRGEVEFSHRRNEFESYEDIYAHTYALMFNGVYDIENSSPITPYLGAGLGIGWIESLSGNPDGSEFAYQFLGGINYEVTDRTDLILGYRYAGMTDVDIDYYGYPASVTVDSHNFELGLRFSF